jgi:hypothetical protein
LTNEEPETMKKELQVDLARELGEEKAAPREEARW